MIINISDYQIKNTTDRAITFKGNRPATVRLETEGESFVDDAPKKRSSVADPIKNIEDINLIIEHFISTGRYRDNLLFVMGISFGLRCGDLLKLKVGHILDNTGNYRSEVTIQEEKTKKLRTCYMSDAVMDAADLYFSSTGNSVSLNDFLFTSRSNNNSSKYYETLKNKTDIKVKSNVDAGMSVRSAEAILKKAINDELGMDIHAGTHCMRKTFAYHVIMNAPDRSRAIEFLQKILGHSSPSTTLFYAGITQDEIKMTCQNLYKGKLNFCYSSGLSIGNGL